MLLGTVGNHQSLGLHLKIRTFDLKGFTVEEVNFTN